MRERPLVLVVEDDGEMNELQRELLEIHGLEGVAAYTGLQALDVAAECRADAVLLDVMLPELDGFETCRRLRKRDGTNLPIIMVTALDSEECRQRGFQAGADAYFAKPFDPDEVIATLRMLIEQARERSGRTDQ